MHRRGRRVSDDQFYVVPTITRQQHDLTNPEWARAFLRFVRCGRAVGVRDYLRIGVSPNVVAPCGRTPLIEAVLARNLAMVKLLLEEGAIPDQIVPSADGEPGAGISALGQAALNGCYEEADLLLAVGADPVKCPEFREYQISVDAVKEMLAAFKAQTMLAEQTKKTHGAACDVK